jgi:phospholipid/cholesterol/gamma-HCH transport system ATP-binding protein
MLYRKHLAMFGPREVLLTSDDPVVSQFLNGRRQGPIGMSEEKDTAQAAREMAEVDQLDGVPPLKPQLEATKGLPERKAVRRRQDRVQRMMHTLPPAAQQAIRASYSEIAAGHGGGAGMDDRTQELPTVGGGSGRMAGRGRSGWE